MRVLFSCRIDTHLGCVLDTRAPLRYIRFNTHNTQTQYAPNSQYAQYAPKTWKVPIRNSNTHFFRLLVLLTPRSWRSTCSGEAILVLSCVLQGQLFLRILAESFLVRNSLLQDTIFIPEPPFPSSVWQKRHGEDFILVCLKGMIFIPEPPYPSAV